MSIERREGHFRSRAKSQPQVGEAELFYQTWISPESRATLVLTHGMGEHSDSYWKTAKDIARLGFDLVAWDVRGHGKSEGKRGHVDSFDDYSHDLAQFLRYLKKAGYLKKPFVLMGHSMGGLITMNYLVSDEFAENPQPVACVLSAPLLDVALAVPPVKEAAAKVAYRIWPSMTLTNEIRDEDLTRDPEWLKTYPRDTLRHDKISPALFFGMFEAMKNVKDKASQITLPIFLQAAGTDKIVSLDAEKEVFARIGSSDKEMVVYDESYHEIYNDLDRDEVLRDLDQFMKRVVGP